MSPGESRWELNPGESRLWENVTSPAGGNADKTGFVNIEVVSRTLSNYGVNIDLKALLGDLDTDGSGEIEFDEFELMMAKAKAEADNQKKAGGSPADSPKPSMGS